MDIQLPDLSEAIQSRVANDSDDNATAQDLQRRRQKRKRKPPSNLKDYYVGSTASTYGVAQINSEYNSNEDLIIGYPYPECGTSTSASHTISYTETLRAMPSSMSTTNPILLIKLIFLRRDPRDLDNAFHAFLNISDSEIRRLARSINIWGLWRERRPEFLCAALLDYWS